MIIQVKSVILEQRMKNERSFMQFCGVGIVWDLIIVSCRSRSWLGGVVGGRREWRQCC